MSKRKKTSVASPPTESGGENESVTTRAVVPPEVMKEAMGSETTDVASEHVEAAEAVEAGEPPPESSGLVVDAEEFDAEMTVNLVGELPLPGRDDLDAPTVTASGETMAEVDSVLSQRKHLRGLLEALVFASDSPISLKEISKLAHAPQKQVKDVLSELQVDYQTRGIHLDEVAGGWVFRTSPKYAPFVRDLTKQKPVRLTRAQVETLAIIAYRQPITRPEIDDVRGVDSGPVLKLLLERDLVRILGKRDEPGRPMIYGTTGQFLEFFGLKSLKDLPTLREFTELSDESREAFEDELGEAPEDANRAGDEAGDLDPEAAERDGEDAGEHDGSVDADEIGRAVRESMRGSSGEESIDDLGADDLEPLDGEDMPEGDDAGDDDLSDKHASDDDGPTLTSEAPVAEDD